MNLNKALVRNARQLAERIHAKHMYGEKQHMYHLDRMAKLLIHFGVNISELDDAELMAAAFLSDSVRLAPVSLLDLHKTFGGQVPFYVYNVTPPLNGPRKLRNRQVFDKLLLWPKAIPLYMTKRIANTEHALKIKDIYLLELFVNEYPEIKETLHDSPRLEHLSEEWGKEYRERWHMMWAYSDTLIQNVKNFLNGVGDERVNRARVGGATSSSLSR